MFTDVPEECVTDIIGHSTRKMIRNYKPIERQIIKHTKTANNGVFWDVTARGSCK
jgi:hypothetical protein